MTERKKADARPCGSCGEGMLRLTNLRGMVMDHKDDPAVRIRSDVSLPVCDICGDMTMRPEQAVALDNALEEAYVAKRRRLQRALINDLRRRGFTQGQIEEFASVSPGYLSKLRNGKVASGSTLRLLYVLHDFPEQALAAVRRFDPRVADFGKKPPRPSPAPLRTGTDG